jgi:hypothetical protein
MQPRADALRTRNDTEAALHCGVLSERKFLIAAIGLGRRCSEVLRRSNFEVPPHHALT